MLVVKMHSGSGKVRGTARSYPYVICSVFKLDDSGRFKNTGKYTQPRRSMRLCEQDGRALAKSLDCKFIEGYGSLHNKREVEITEFFTER